VNVNARMLAIYGQTLRGQSLPHRASLSVGRGSMLAMATSAGLTQADVAEAMGVTQQRVSAIENGAVAELAILADYIRALGGELKVIADFGDTWRRVA
jgi:DNA-binding XRE family transcriptional regulator